MIDPYVPRIDPVLGIVRRCPTCNETWPDDEEFYRDPRRGPCKACEYEFAARRRASVARAARAYRARLRASA